MGYMLTDPEICYNQHALFVGFVCTQSALVSINRLHRSPRPYDNRILENLKLAFIVLGALKTFYAPAKEWVCSILSKQNGFYFAHPADNSEFVFIAITDGCPLSCPRHKYPTQTCI